MSQRNESRTSSAATQRAAFAFTRRTLLKSAAATASLSIAAPLVAKRALSSSGEVNVYAWDEYVSQDMVSKFEGKTGIKLNLSTFGTNNEVLNKLRAAKGQGFDVVFPSVSALQMWYDASDEDGVDLLQSIDESRVKVDQIQPAIWEKSLDLGASRRGKRFAVPFNWGTEGVAFNSEERDLSYGKASWNSQWEAANEGLVTVRPRSGLTTIALMLDGTGKMLDEAYLDEQKCRKVFGQALDFALTHKKWVKVFWKTANDLTTAYLQEGCVIGQSWDGTAINMWKQSNGKIKYVAPVEGALTWLDTMCLTSGAQNIDQSYELINWLASEEGGGLHAAHSGYNSAAIGAEKYLDPEAQDRFKFIYGAKGEAIARLWWWKPEAGWFGNIRAEHITRWETA